jgi:hypothetical protein
MTPSTFLIAFTQFLHRVIIALRFNCPLNLLQLSIQAVGFLLSDVKAKVGQSLFRLKGINDFLCNTSARKIDYGLMQSHFLPITGQIYTANDKVIYAELQLAFWNSFPELVSRLYSEYAHAFMEDCSKVIRWSSIDIIAKTNAIGAQLAKEAIGPAWASEPVTVRVLVAFRAISDKEFATAVQILESDFERVKKTYGTSSTELWL